MIIDGVDCGNLFDYLRAVSFFSLRGMQLVLAEAGFSPESKQRKVSTYL